MKTRLFLLAITVMLLCPAVSFSMDSTYNNKVKAVYASAVDSEIAFYEARLYLMDSEYRILSEIGNEAADRVAYLKTVRGQLVEKMVSENVPLKTDCLKCYLGKHFQENKLLDQTYVSAR